MNLLNSSNVRHSINRLKRHAAAYALFSCFSTLAIAQTTGQEAPKMFKSGSEQSWAQLPPSIPFTNPFQKLEAPCSHSQTHATNLDGLLMDTDQSVANDFIVSANTLNYTVKGLHINLLSTTAIKTLKITFYEDSDGVPGDIYGSKIISSPTSQTVFKEDDGTLFTTAYLKFPTPLEFPGNGKTAVRYWMQVEADEVTENSRGVSWQTSTKDIIGRYSAFSNQSTGHVWRVGSLPLFRNEGVFTLDAECSYITGCFQPSDFKLEETLGTKASFSWNNTNETIGKWNFAYVESGRGIANATIVTTSTPNYSVDLEGGKSYDFFVQSVCDDANVSVWTNPITLNLDYCIPVSTGFTSWISKFVTTGAITNMNYAQTKLPNGGYDKRTDIVIEQYAGSEISFNSTFTDDMVGIGIWADWDNNLVFDKSDELFQKSYLDYTQKGTFKIPENTPEGNYRMRIRAEFTYGHDVNACNTVNWGSAIDVTIKILPKASCSAPTELKTTYLNQTSAKVNWVNDGEVASWNVEYGPNGFKLGEGIKANVTTAEILLNNLTANTTYDVYVQTVCNDLNSTNVGPYKVSTLCNAKAVPYVMDFETSVSDDIPACTTKEALNNSKQWLVLTSPGYGFNSKTLNYVYDEKNDANAWFYTQGIELKANELYTITYRYGNNATDKTEKLRVAIGELPTSENMTHTIFDHTAVRTGKAQVNETLFMPTKDGIYYVGFNAYSEKNNWNLFVDDIKVNKLLNTTEVSLSTVKIHPNPVKDVLNVSSPNQIDKAEVYTLLGQKILELTPKKKETTINVSTLTKGTYLIVLTSNDQKQSLKFIVN